MDAPSQEEPCEPQRERAGRSYEKESLRFFLFSFAQMRAKDFAERRADEVHARPWNERPGIREVLIQMAAEEDLFQANVKKVQRMPRDDDGPRKRESGDPGGDSHSNRY